MIIRKWTSSNKTIKIKLDKLKSSGGVDMNKFKSFNLNILQNKKTTIISTQESLKDVTPINWSEEVLISKDDEWINETEWDKLYDDIRGNRGMKTMAVSMATVPVIKGDSARQMLEALKTPTITKKFIEECKKETKGITIRRVK